MISISDRRVLMTIGLSVLFACSGGAGMAHTQVGGPAENPNEPAPPEESTSAANAKPTTFIPPAPSTSSSEVAAAVPSASASTSASVAAPVAPPALRLLKGTVTAKPANAAAYSVVFLEDGPSDPERGMKATMDQKNMFFIPGTVVVAVGGTVTFFNSDPFPHNIFSMDGEKFNLGVIPQGGSGKKKFTERGAYTLLCNLHPGMIGHVVVVPTGYFAKADKNGAYVMKDVPEGTYKISIWANKYSAPTQSVTIKDGDATADFALSK